MEKNRERNFIFYILEAVLVVVALLFACTGAVIDWKWQQRDKQAGAFSEDALAALTEQLPDSADQDKCTSLIEGEEIEIFIEPEEASAGTEDLLNSKADQQAAEQGNDLYSVIPEVMPYTVIDGISYLGILSIPDISISLPVILLEQWDAEMMDYAPCTYSGSLKTSDLVIMAHNYESHFRPILTMQPGQTVKLTTADGLIYTYTVTAVDVMHRSQKEKLYEGEWDLTLFTCVPQTFNRCAVRCKLLSVSS